MLLEIILFLVLLFATIFMLADLEDNNVKVEFKITSILFCILQVFGFLGLANFNLDYIFEKNIIDIGSIFYAIGTCFLVEMAFICIGVQYKVFKRNNNK